MMGKLTFGRHAAKQLVAQIDISQKKFYILFIKVDTPKYAKYAYLGTYLGSQNMVEWGIPEKILQNAVQTRWS